jgi:hypothetical protein
MNDADRAKLQRILASFDERGLIALANKGLVRRAQKDLEAGGLRHEETAAALVVHGPGWVVTMPPDGPTHARDDTKASGVTRQILTATIYLREQWAGAAAGTEPAPESPVAKPAVEAPKPNEQPPLPAEPPADVAALEAALLDLSVDELQKWAGKTTLREVAPLVKAGMEVEVETHAGVTIRLVRQEIEVRLLPARGKRSARALLEEILTTAPRSQHKRWVVAAILAFQQSRGRTLQLEAPQTVPAEEAGAPRSRQETLIATQDLLASMVTTGLAHPSARMLERLSTLSVASTAVHLPRLARLLRSLAEEVAQLLARDASADTSRFFDRVCLTYALARALTAVGPQAPIALAGQHRTLYEPVGDLQLAGVGAYPWQTASGFKGLTVLLWDLSGKRFVTWTASRPTGAPGYFDLEHAYRSESVWSGGGAPESFSRSQFTLRQARANAVGRLSASASTSITGLHPADPSRIDFAGRLFTNWRTLLGHALTLYPIGLKEKNPLDQLVVVQPAQWGERYFDELQQRFCWPVQDDEASTIVLTLAWTGVNETAIEFLELLNSARDQLAGVVVRLAFGNQGVLVEPLSVLSRGTPNGQRVLNPAFDRALITSRHAALLDRLRKKYGRDRIPTVLTADDEGDAALPETGFLEGVPAGIQTRLSEVESLLLPIAEAGLGRLNEPARQRLRQLAAAFDRLGLREMVTGLADLEQAPDAAATVIWNGYLCRLHREALRLKLCGQAG